MLSYQSAGATACYRPLRPHLDLWGARNGGLALFRSQSELRQCELALAMILPHAMMFTFGMSECDPVRTDAASSR